jgi:Caspase domain
MLRRISIAALIVTLTAPAAAAPPVSAKTGDAVFAVIVANNRSQDRALGNLSFADDDGAKYYELFSALGQRTTLLSVLDPATQARFPKVRGKAVPPKKAAVLRALKRTFADVRRARARGQRTVFYFLFSGHGGVHESGMGYVHLLDGTLTRSEIFRNVIAPSPASVNHVIIDACHAYFMVHAKGGWRDDDAGGATRGLLHRFLQAEALERYPNTGVVLATSSSAETHEWSRFQGGVFSHEVRSAMTGAADVDGDRAVSYSELAAYVAAANSKVTNSKAHLKIFTRPPVQNVSEPVMRLARPALHRVKVGRAMTGHFFLEDIRGVRYADFNKSSEQDLTIVLPGTSPTYYLRSSSGEARITLQTPPGVVSVDELSPQAFSARGSMEEALRRGLYAVPYGRSFHSGFLTAWRRSLSEPMPGLKQQQLVSTTPRWRLGAGYLMTTPVLDRGGLVHGVELRADRQIWGPLRAGLSLSYGHSSHDLGSQGASMVAQHRIAAAAVVSARWELRPWLALDAGLALGYLALLESGAAETSGDAAAFTLMAGAGPEIRVVPGLWARIAGHLVVDVYATDAEQRTHLAPALTAGLVTLF